MRLRMMRFAQYDGGRKNGFQLARNDKVLRLVCREKGKVQDNAMILRTYSRRGKSKLFVTKNIIRHS